MMFHKVFNGLKGIVDFDVIDVHCQYDHWKKVYDSPVLMRLQK